MVLGMVGSAWNYQIVVAQLFHEIAPPVDYSLIPRWVVFAIAFLVLSLIGLAIWLFARRSKPQPPPKLPRQRALDALDSMGERLDQIDPYRFSIELSDILRSYVTDQFGLPV